MRRLGRRFLQLPPALLPAALHLGLLQGRGPAGLVPGGAGGTVLDPHVAQGVDAVGLAEARRDAEHERAGQVVQPRRGYPDEAGTASASTAPSTAAGTAAGHGHATASAPAGTAAAAAAAATITARRHSSA